VADFIKEYQNTYGIEISTSRVKEAIQVRAIDLILQAHQDALRKELFWTNTPALISPVRLAHSTSRVKEAIQVLQGHFVSKEAEYQKYCQIDILENDPAYIIEDKSLPQFIRRLTSLLEYFSYNTNGSSDFIPGK